MSRGRLFQIDVLKAVAIGSVIVIHSVPVAWLIQSWGVLWVWQAVPLFIAVMGLNTYASLLRRGVCGPHAHDLDAGALRSYLVSRFLRLLVPFAAVWLLLLLVALWTGRPMYIGWMTLLLKTPLPVPGNYFVPVAVQLVLVGPWIASAYSRRPRVVLGGAIAANLMFEVAAPFLPIIQSHRFLYDACALRYVSLFVVGFWMVQRHQDRRPVLTPPLVGAALVSFAYLAYTNVTGDNLVFIDEWRWQNVAGFGYTALLAALALTYVRETSSGPLAVPVLRVSAASYHVFLVQMVYFGLLPTGWRPMLLPVNLALCLAGGVLFYRAAGLIQKRVRIMGA